MNKSGPWPLILSGWLLAFAFMNYHWGMPVLSGQLGDADNYLRMVRVFDLMDGSHYPSNLQPRLGPAGVIENNWSRLVDIPLYALMAALQPVAGRAQAALLTATIIPAAALLLLLCVCVWYPRAAVAPAGRPGSGYIAVIFALVLCQAEMVSQFLPGSVDHHMWQIILAAGAFGCLLRCVQAPAKAVWAAAAGALFAAGLAIGADMVPWFALGTAFLGLHFLAEGRAYEKAGLVFALSAAASSLCLFALLRPREYFFEPACDGLSIVYVAFAFAVAAFWSGMRLLPPALKASPARRTAASVALSAAIAGGLYALFPACLRDPYQLNDPVVRRIWLDQVTEAQSLAALAAHRPLYAVSILMITALSVAIADGLAWRGRENRVMWAGWCVILLAGLLLSFWQIRMLRILQVLIILPLAWPLPFLAGLQGDAAGPRRRLPAAALALTAVLGAALCLWGAVRRGGEPDPVLAAQRPVQSECRLEKAASVLDTLPPGLVAAYIDNGPEILYRTRHSALAGPYHRDAAGIKADFELFTAADAEKARRAAAGAGVRIVMVCPAERSYWKSVAPQPSFFAGQLLDGRIPRWLAPVRGSGAGGFMIFQVRP